LKNTWAVIKGQRALEPKWDHGEFLSWDSTRIKNMMEEKSTGKAVIAREDGDLTSLNGDEKIECIRSALLLPTPQWSL
jgi:hypothetical protein